MEGQQQSFTQVARSVQTPTAPEISTAKTTRMKNASRFTSPTPLVPWMQNTVSWFRWQEESLKDIGKHSLFPGLGLEFESHT
jgi:hypothetical protein